MTSSGIPADITNDLAAAFRADEAETGDEAWFDDLARRIFAFQYEHNPPFAAYCRRRGRSPDTVVHWTGIPAVPTAAFREATLVAGSAATAEAVFRTSGTTSARRGEHHVLDLSLYHGSLLSSFKAMVLADDARLAMLSLVPSSREVPDSSLSHMIDTAIASFGSARSGGFASAAEGIDHGALNRALLDAIADSEPVCLLGTSFAFVHLIDALQSSGRRYRLPEGTRIMDTGGFKGRSREVSETEMRAAYEKVFGVPASHCINEYGMTEMCSQFYDATLRDAVTGRTGEPRRKVGPAWVRTRVVHADTLEPVAAGHTGILQHFDLANAGSVCCIQTEDTGIVAGDGFHVLGRSPGATPRGCSIAMDEMLGALARRP